jgi:Ethylene-responsive binding factor-associated repression/Putative nuclear localisation signal
MGESPRDFFLQISAPNPVQSKPDKHSEESNEIELSLDLSLNGCFGVDPHLKTNLIRSSSIASFPSLVAGAEHERPVASVSLMRTTSLPGEEMQVLKRLEAKRKRLERRNSINKNVGRSESSVERCEEDLDSKRRKVEGTGEIFNGTTGRVDLGSTVAGLKSQRSTSSIDVAGLCVRPFQSINVYHFISAYFLLQFHEIGFDWLVARFNEVLLVSFLNCSDITIMHETN